jgi:uncharacterized alkaline shock family protein YloU
MPERPALRPAPGRAIVRRRAIEEIVRTAVLGSYGVTGLSARSLLERIRARLGAAQPGIRVRLAPEPNVDIWVTVAYGVPVAEVARQVDSAIRYSLRRALGRDVGRVAIHVDGLSSGPFSTAGPVTAAPPAVGRDVAVSSSGPRVGEGPPDGSA